MPLRPIPYEQLEPLVRDYLSIEEDMETAELIRRLRGARERGYLTEVELEAVCHGKAPRAMRLIKANSPTQVRAATNAALRTRSERRRLEALTSLKGVSVPMASAVLMLLDPKRYGVIDIRVWQLLYSLGTVRKNPGGAGFNFRNWYQFLMIIRYIAKKFGVMARDVERTLFPAHKEYQAGRLYDARGSNNATV